MTQRGFRTILIAHISTLTLGTAAGVAYPYLLPPSLVQTYDALEATHADGWVALAIVLLLIGMLTGYVGLFLWRSWGRSSIARHNHYWLRALPVPWACHRILARISASRAIDAFLGRGISTGLLQSGEQSVWR